MYVQRPTDFRLGFFLVSGAIVFWNWDCLRRNTPPLLRWTAQGAQVHCLVCRRESVEGKVHFARVQNKNDTSVGVQSQRPDVIKQVIPNWNLCDVTQILLVLKLVTWIRCAVQQLLSFKVMCVCVLSIMHSCTIYSTKDNGPFPHKILCQQPLCHSWIAECV